MTERTFAVRFLKSLAAQGWSVTGIYNGGDDIEQGDMTPAQAVGEVMAAEMGFVQIAHPTHGSATLHLLFQGGEPEEVIYDISASTIPTFDIIDQALAAFQGA